MNYSGVEQWLIEYGTGKEKCFNETVWNTENTNIIKILIPM